MIGKFVSALGVGVGTAISLCAVALVIILSVWMNGYFAFVRLGGVVDAVDFNTATIAPLAAGVAVAAIDVLKAFAPVWMTRAWQHRRYIHASLSFVLLLTGMTLSLSAAYGLIIEQRTGVTSDRQANQAELHDALAGKERIEAQLSHLGFTRPADTIAAELRAQEQHARWEATNGCVDATANKSREFCTQYNELKAEEARAEAVALERTRLAELETKITQLRAGGANRLADPQLESLAKVSGIPAARLEVGLLLLIAAAMEFVSSFGLFLVLGHGPKPPTQVAPPAAQTLPTMTAAPASPTHLGHKTAVKDVAPHERDERKALPAPAQAMVEEVSQYGVARLEHMPGMAITLRELHEDYATWCTREGRTPVTLRKFTTTLEEIAANVPDIKLGLYKRKRALLDMQLRRDRAAA